MESANLQSYVQLLDTDDSLHFSLLRLQLIELIRACTSGPSGDTNSPDVSAALQFATTHLAPLAPTNPAFLADLERTMALLIFPTDNLAPQLAELIDPQLRKSVANRVNEAILSSQGARRESQIRKLVRMRAWSEKIARESKKLEIPDGGLGFGLDEQLSPASGRAQANRNEVRPFQPTSEADGDTTMREGNGEREAMVS
jgi:glucose-induced degradation protein 8